MHWNYRLFKQDGSTNVKDKMNIQVPVDAYFFVGECYYDDRGKPELHSDMSHNLISGDTAQITKATYTQISEAFAAPIIELDEDGGFK